MLQSNSRFKEVAAAVLFIVLVLILFFFGISSIPLWSSDEGRYAAMASEMWHSKDFIVPHFNHLAYLEKPILAPALTAMCYAVLDETALATRLPSILSALMGLLICFQFTRKFFNVESARWAVLILATSIGYVLVGRFAVIDMLMTLLLSAALFSLMTAFFEKKPNFYLIAYGFMGLAFLTKGLIGILLPGLIFFVFLLATNNLKELKNARIGWGILIVAVIVVPWVLAISQREPQFIDVFIIKHHFARFSSATFGRKRPIWFFIPIFFALAMPWSFFLFAAVKNGLRAEGMLKNKNKFLLIWIAVVVLFFSIPKSKLPYYILPVSMPVAILVGSYFARRSLEASPAKSVWVSWLAWTLLISFGLGAVGLNVAVFSGMIKKTAALSLKPILPWISLVLFAGFALAFFFYKSNQERRSFVTFAAVIYVGLLFTFVAMRIISPFQSTFEFAEALKPKLQSSDLVAIYASPDHFSDLPVHLSRRIAIVGSDRGTLAAESRDPANAEKVKGWFFETSEFIRLFQSKQTRIFCLLDDDKLEELKNQGLIDFVIAKSNSGKILITNGNI